MLVPKYTVHFHDEPANTPEPHSLAFMVCATAGGGNSSILRESIFRRALNDMFGYATYGQYVGGTTSAFLGRVPLLWARVTEQRKSEISEAGFNIVASAAGHPVVYSCQLTNGIHLADLLSVALLLDALQYVAEFNADDILCGELDRATAFIEYKWLTRKNDLIRYGILHEQDASFERIPSTSALRVRTMFNLNNTTHSVDVIYEPGVGNKVATTFITDPVLAQSLYNVYGINVRTW